MIVDTDRLADRLITAARDSKQIQPFACEHELTLADAYAIQNALIARSVAAGRKRIGYKLGFTLVAVQRMLQVNAPIHGVLFDDMVFANGHDVPTAHFIAPRVEVELLFVLGKSISGTRRTLIDVLSAIDYVTAAMEIIDSRVAAPASAADIVADNAGAAGVILGGRPVRVDKFDLRWVSALLHRDGVIEDSGVAAAVLGHPAAGIVSLLDALDSVGGGLHPGDMVLAGSFTLPLAVAKDQCVHADYGALGSISVKFA